MVRRTLRFGYGVDAPPPETHAQGRFDRGAREVAEYTGKEAVVYVRVELGNHINNALLFPSLDGHE